MWRILFVLFISLNVSGADIFRQLIAAVNSGDEGKICAVLSHTGSEPTKRLTQLLLQLGVQTRSQKVYESIVKALQAVRGKDAFSVLALALKQKSFQLRMLSLFALEGIPLPKSVDLIIPVLKDRNSDLRIQAARALGRKSLKKSVKGLIDIIAFADKIGGEFSASVRRALYSITGQNMKSASDWAKWWQLAKDNWKPLQGVISGHTKITQVKPPGNYPRFFGVEVFSLRVVFIIDISGSMNDPASGFNMSRVELVKQELIKTIMGLKAKAHFTVIAFNSKITSFSKDLVPASPQNKAKAIKMVRAFKADSTTWTQEALEKAFSYKSANTIVLLSDGCPCKGNGLLPTRPILDWVKLTNRFRKVTIHTVGFPDAFIPFLTSIARENGGSYRSARPLERAKEHSDNKFDDYK